MATLDGMWDRTITVNSFSKSWNISGWRLGYVYGTSKLIAPMNNSNNVFYVCSPTPLQLALAEVLMSDPDYYIRLRETFTEKRRVAVEALSEAGFKIYDSGSAFYVWARIPDGYDDAIAFNEMLISKGVAGVPRASLVILLATVASFNLPAWPVFIILGLDALMDMARTAVNVIGNCLATAVVARWEGEFVDNFVAPPLEELAESDSALAHSAH
jgi:hypothetical protein